MTQNALQLRPLTLQEAELIHQTQMPQDFPPAEVKPFYIMKSGFEAGFYRFYGAFDAEGKLACYAFFLLSTEKHADGTQDALLDYLAVPAESRSSGNGSWMLQHLSAELSDIRQFLIEIEDPELSKDKAELAQRERRKRFYLRNGARLSDVKTRIFGVPYRMLVFTELKELPEDEDIRSLLRGLYGQMLPKELYTEENIKI